MLTRAEHQPLFRKNAFFPLSSQWMPTRTCLSQWTQAAPKISIEVARQNFIPLITRTLQQRRRRRIPSMERRIDTDSLHIFYNRIAPLVTLLSPERWLLFPLIQRPMWQGHHCHQRPHETNIMELPGFSPSLCT